MPLTPTQRDVLAELERRELTGRTSRAVNEVVCEELKAAGLVHLVRLTNSPVYRPTNLGILALNETTKGGV
jgi:hypothetical protein